MEFKRKAIEIGKMMSRMYQESKPYSIEYHGNGEYIINGKDYTGCGLYDSIKEQYMKFLGYEYTELVSLDLDDDLYEKLCIMSDEQMITVDELVIDILTSFIVKDNMLGNGI